MTEPHRYSIGPLAMAVDPGDIDVWLHCAKAGDRMVYATGLALPQKAAGVLRVRELIASHAVNAHCRRVDRGSEWFVVRRAPDSAADPHISHAGRLPRFAPDESLEARVLRQLWRAAASGLVCPTNAELAQMCRLPTADAASYRMRKLVSQGLIRIEDNGPRFRRIVTIVASREKTVEGLL